jgi:hypothetical protein
MTHPSLIKAHATTTARRLAGDIVAGANACPNYPHLDDRNAWCDHYATESLRISKTQPSIHADLQAKMPQKAHGLCAA